MNKQILIKIEFFLIFITFFLCLFPLLYTASSHKFPFMFSFSFRSSIRYALVISSARMKYMRENTMLCLTTHKFQFNILWNSKKFINFPPWTYCCCYRMKAVVVESDVNYIKLNPLSWIWSSYHRVSIH